ncbi:glycoside hydrolase family 3 C-terminal domain-containing protein [Kushneria marisflavi]|uniref:Beta-D-glucoside glucohydrolase n=1 Tax=Kushneria marisflavi TaxID=157779 RepID=A0A240UQX8_9GAMM|nr:glycoside hydrolase family 3 C-terminal domain-containing protein [Kushneria marisflavi]ART63442.1 glycosyl hydrolase [Kushneria marisflavi]RKD84500.1 beta-glucosidase [Kushneria marisflavi]
MRDWQTLIEQMTLEEKAGLCSGENFWRTKAIERLGIPAINLSDGPHGLRAQGEEQDHLGVNDSKPATCFPTAAGLASSWSIERLEQLGAALGDEAQAEGLHVVLGPGANIKRSPLCGRNFEYFSEDPLLSSHLAAAHIRGTQSRGVGSSLKHFVANNQEHRRMSVDARIDERTLREIYLASFEHAVKQAQPWTVMCAYNRVNGDYCSEHRRLLTDILRDEWGFEGVVVSDWGAVNERVPGLEAGMELEMPAPIGERDAQIAAAVREGRLEEAVLDRAVERLLRLIFQAHDARLEQAHFDTEAHHQLARHIARDSMVLLQNDGTLPLTDTQRVAVIGEFAERPRYQGGGSSHVNATRVETLLEALKTRNASFDYTKGFEIDRDAPDQPLEQDAATAASHADVAVLCLGLPERHESEGYDRTHLNLPANQLALIEAVTRAQPNTVVVLANGSPIAMPWAGRVSAILEGYLGGQAVGAALADLLYGEVSPSGKLAETFPRRLEDTPAYLNFPGEGDVVRYGEGIFVGYRHYDTLGTEPLFPFGHGLSYSRFDYANLALSASVYDGQGALTVSCDITNSGEIEASEIVQLYLSDRTQTVPVAEQTLRGFDRVTLAPGETARIELSLTRRDFCWYDAERAEWRLPTGTFEVRIGASSRDIRLSRCLEVQGDETPLPDIDRNTLLGDLQRRDDTTRVLREHLADIADELPMLNGLMGRSGGDDLMDAMGHYLPLRALVSFSSFTEARLETLLKDLGALASP